MNFMISHQSDSIRVLIVNPLVPASQLLITKILAGTVFGLKQLVDLTLLVYSNEIPEAEAFIQEILGCNFGCFNTIVATSDLPSITDADVFCFMTTFPNPNIVDFDHINTDEHFDNMYLIIKVADALGKSVTEAEKLGDNYKKPILFGDGLIVIDILNSIGKLNSVAYCFSPSVITAIANVVLSDCLKVQNKHINVIHVWGANDQEFHVEVEKPFVVYDTIEDTEHCDWEVVSKEVLAPLKLDRTQFNASWMRNEFIKKIRTISCKNPYGDIFKGWKLAKMLSQLWLPRINQQEFPLNIGLISDGSLRTEKGLPYILPLIFFGEKWKVDERFIHLPHVQQEIKRYNAIVTKSHAKLVRYCEKFLEQNVINLDFVPPDQESRTTFSYDKDDS